MADPVDVLRQQLDLTWALAGHYLPRLTDEMCLWEPAPGAWTVREVDGRWVADLAEEEPAGLRTTVAWTAWHMTWWWSGALAVARGEVPPPPAAVEYAGSADGVRSRLDELAAAWRGVLTGAGLDRPVAFPWPEERPFAMTAAWVNMELMKDVAEMGANVRLYEAAWR